MGERAEAGPRQAPSTVAEDGTKKDVLLGFTLCGLSPFMIHQ